VAQEQVDWDTPVSSTPTGVRTGKKIAFKLVWKVCLMAKSGPGIMVSPDLSLINMVVVISASK
jgi:hypothetical protein